MCVPSVSSRFPTNSLRRVDLPAPLAPTMAIRESQSMAKFTPLKIIFSFEYPKRPSSILSKGGRSFSGVGKMKTQLGSSMMSSTCSNLPIALIRLYTRAALFALYLNLSMNSCM